MDGSPGKAMSLQMEQLLLDSADLRTFMSGLAEAIADRLHAPTSCSVALQRARRGTSVAFTDTAAEKWDQVQFDEGEGPVLDALRTGTAVSSEDLWAERKWPLLAAQIGDLGPRSVIAAPIPVEGTAVAALTCYRPEAGAFSSRALELVSELASAAATSLSLAVRLAAGAEREADLDAALDTRTPINLAAGIIMAQSHCSQDEAMEILVRASNDRNQKLRELAVEMVAKYDPADPAAHFE